MMVAYFGEKTCLFSGSRLKKGASAFTLIELLIVISIIAVLAALLFPAIGGAMKQAEKTKAKSEMKSYAAAVAAFYATYGKYPVSAGAQGVADKMKKDDKSKAVVKALIANDDDINPRKIVFLETEDTNGDFLDPWGTQYAINFDTDYDGKVNHHGKNSSSAIAMSAGPNETWDEDPVGSDDLSTVHN